MDPNEKGQPPRSSLPVHPYKAEQSRTGALRVSGLVGKSLELTLADLERLPQTDLTDDFTCVEGWTVPQLKWGGVLLETVLSLAEPAAAARYVQATAGEFSLPLSREVAQRALLAIHLNSEALPVEHGGPIRLVVPGGQCFTSVKWLETLELRAEAGPNTAEKIAMDRLRNKSAAP
jgi:DMSO/TMAO reductase YedYZ molybdopterin-dependent catalytic subunit